MTSSKHRGGLPAYFLLFPAVFTYYEIIFKLTTVGGVLSPGTVFTFVFSVAYGAVCYLLTSLSKNEKVNRVITAVLLSLTAVVFLIESFVYRSFKIFYDLKTVTGGAGGVATSFLDTALSMIFSLTGLLRIVLFALPIVLFLVFGKKLMPAVRGTALTRVAAACLAVIFFVLGVTSLSSSPLGEKYRNEYDFQDAVANFGLLTGVRLDITKTLFPKKSGERFIMTPETEPAETEPAETAPETVPATGTETAEPAPEPVVYGDNVMAIDFDALAASGGAAAEIDSYVSTLKPTKKNAYTGLFEGKNLIFITAEAFTAEAIDEKLTPTLYRLATKGFNFTDYYQPTSAGTTGGEYQNLLGLLPSWGGMSLKESAEHSMYFTLGNRLDALGYYGRAYHDHYASYYDRDVTHPRLGYSDGFIGLGNGIEEYVTECWPESDLEMMAGSLKDYIDRDHFNVYYMSVSGHGSYLPSVNSMAAKNWDLVKDMKCSDAVKGYYASNIELDRGLGAIVAALEEKGIADDTVICISADHFPYALDDETLGGLPNLEELYGFKVKNVFDRDHNRLILWCGSLEKEAPVTVSEPTSSLDVLPTLLNLFGIEYDSRLLPGRDVFSDSEALVFNITYDWRTSLGTYISSSGVFTPASPDVTVPDGYVERMKAVVHNKVQYCESVLETDYYAHVFGN